MGLTQYVGVYISRQRLCCLANPSQAELSSMLPVCAKPNHLFLDAASRACGNTTPRSNAPVEVQPETGFRFRPIGAIWFQVPDRQICTVMTTLNQINQPRPHFPGSPVNPLRAETTDHVHQNQILSLRTLSKTIECGFSFWHLFSRDRVPG